MDFETKTRLAASSSKDENKTLDMIINPATNKIVFVIKNNRIEISNCVSIDDAIAAYNDA